MSYNCMLCNFDYSFVIRLVLDCIILGVTCAVIMSNHVSVVYRSANFEIRYDLMEDIYVRPKASI